MTLLFLLALLLAWPTYGVSIALWLVLLFVRAIVKAQMRMHHADVLQARRDAAASNQSQSSLSLSVQALRHWLEHETSWQRGPDSTDAELLASTTLVLGDAISGDARHPKVQDVPADILLLSSLQDLHLQYNDLHELPLRICAISSLKKLRLGGNQLRVLPAAIAQLDQLELLTLWSNQLTALPEQIGELRQLRALNIAHNPDLTFLPDSIVQLQQLREFDWYGPGEKHLTAAQRQWLRQLHANGCEILLNDEQFLVPSGD